MPLAPPKPTPFPYTTLFRSHVPPGAQVVEHERSSEGHAHEAEEQSDSAINEPHHAERPHLCGVAVQLKSKAGNRRNRHRHGTPASGTESLPRLHTLTTSAAIH